MRDKIRPLICEDGYDAEARLDKIMEIIELEFQKLKRENFGLKTTVKNLREKVERFYRGR